MLRSMSWRSGEPALPVGEKQTHALKPYAQLLIGVLTEAALCFVSAGALNQPLMTLCGGNTGNHFLTLPFFSLFERRTK